MYSFIKYSPLGNHQSIDVALGSPGPSTLKGQRCYETSWLITIFRRSALFFTANYRLFFYSDYDTWNNTKHDTWFKAKMWETTQDRVQESIRLEREREIIAHPKRFFLGGLFLFGLLLEFVVRHGDNGQDQIYKVERTQEDNHNEEEHVPRSSWS